MAAGIGSGLTKRGCVVGPSNGNIASSAYALPPPALQGRARPAPVRAPAFKNCLRVNIVFLLSISPARRGGAGGVAGDGNVARRVEGGDRIAIGGVRLQPFVAVGGSGHRGCAGEGRSAIEVVAGQAQ